MLVGLGVCLVRKKRKRPQLREQDREAPSAPADAPPLEPEEAQAPPADGDGCPACSDSLPLSYLTTRGGDPSTPPLCLPPNPSEAPPAEGVSGSDGASQDGPLELPLSYITTLGSVGGEVDTLITPPRSSAAEAAEAGSEPGTPPAQGASELDTFLTPEQTGDVGAPTRCAPWPPLRHSSRCCMPLVWQRGRSRGVASSGTRMDTSAFGPPATYAFHTTLQC